MGGGRVDCTTEMRDSVGLALVEALESLEKSTEGHHDAFARVECPVTVNRNDCRQTRTELEDRTAGHTLYVHVQLVLLQRIIESSNRLRDHNKVLL